MNLIDVLAHHARTRGDRVAYTFLLDGETRAVELTWAELERGVAAVAAQLAGAVAPGARAVLVYPPGLEYITAFLGCLAAGVIAVPAYPPDPARMARTLPRLRAIAADAGATAVLTTPAIAALAAVVGADAPELARARWIATHEAAPGEGAVSQQVLPPGNVAFLQYTSGSTSAPRGVVVTHANLIGNQQAIQAAFATREDDVIVGWLPLYHDMGLIGNVLHALWLGARCVLMSPMAFLQRPRRWLDAIARHRGTVSGGPNFAFDLCVRRTTAEERASIDLSSWRLAFSGAEPVRAATLARFAEAFAPAGFDRRAYYPCYGLAEATLLVTGGTSGAGATTIGLERAALAAGAARPGPELHVGCGQIAVAHRLALVEPSTGVPCGDGAVGEIWVQGPSVAAAYWGRPEESERTFAARTADGDGPWLRTGDLGAVVDGALIVAGRIKDVIIVRGRNVYPQDVELAAEQASAHVRPGCAAAFGGDDDAIVVVAEVDAGDEAVAAAVRGAVAEACEVAVDEVVLVARGTIPKTSSGKIQRHAAKQAWRAGELAVVARLARGAGPAAELRAAIARVLGVATIAADVPLTSLGLDSLGAIEVAAAAEALGVQLDVAHLLGGATLADLGGIPAAAAPAAPPVAEPLDGPASGGQRAMWLTAELAPASPALHVAPALRLRGRLDVNALHGALQRLVDRHPALRTTFVEGDELRQQVAPWIPISLIRADAARLDDDGVAGQLAALAAEPFDLARGPLLRAALLVRGPDDHVLLLCAHHAIVDLASLAILVRELDATYRALVARQPLPAVEVAPGPIGFAGREATWLAGAGAADVAWWLERLRDLPVLDLPTDRPRPAVPSLRGATVRRRVPVAGVHELARARGATPFAVIAAAYAATLRRHAGCDEVVIGTPTANRGRAADAGVVGYLVSPVALRVDLREACFGDVIDRAAIAAREALARAAVPVGELAARLGGRHGLYQVGLVLEQGRDPLGRQLAAIAVGAPARLSLLGVEAEAIPVEVAGAQLDLMLRVAEHDGELEVALEYATDLFDAGTAARLLAHWAALLADGVTRPDQPIDELTWASADERRALLAALDATAGLPASEARLGDAFWAHADVAPDDLALVAGTERLSYGELAARAAGIAGELAARGVGRGDRVAVALPRTPALIATLLGILRVGAAYVPVDPRYPEARRRAILDDAAPRLVIAEPIHAPPSAAPPPCPAAPGDLAYVLFTSGSTGRPKGVAIEHASAVAFLAWCDQAFSAAELARVLFATSLGFDLSVFEIFAPLARGGAIVLAEDALALPELPAAGEVTLVNTVPSAMRELLALGGLPASVRTVNLAGEPLPPELAAAVYREPGVERLWNLYGPTEDTTYSTAAIVPRDGGRVTIGRPIRGTRAYLLDRAGRLVPRGVPGELHLAGAGLARGYLGRPELTAERFVPDPFTGGRMYRTGDLVRMDAAGELEYLGRLDHQVKIRGYRIELGEIDGALRGQPGVEDVAVVARDGALVAYVVGGAAPGALRAHLASVLPDFMVPAAMVSLAALPRTPNGKLDRAALPAPSLTPGNAAPRTAVERQVAAIVAGVLGVARVGVDDDFFALGGHSLAAVRVVARIRRELGVELPVRGVFEAPTVAALAARIAEAAPALATPRADRDGDLRLGPAEERVWTAHQLDPSSTRWHLAATLALHGRLDAAAIASAWSALVGRHEALRTRVVTGDDGRPRRAIDPAGAELATLDLAEVPVERRAAAAEAAHHALAGRPFELATEAPARAQLVRIADEHHVLAIVLHHVAVDGWSIRILLDELAARLAGEPVDHAPALAPADLPVARDDDGASARAAALHGAPAVLELLPDPDGAPGRVAIALDRAAIDAFARAHGATPAAVLLAAWAVVLARHAGQREVIIGVPAAARGRVEHEGVVGCLVNTVPVRIAVDDDRPVAALLAQVVAELGRALDAQDVALDDVVAALGIERAPGRAPLVQALLGVQPAPLAARRAGALTIEPVVRPGTAPHAELALDLWDDGVRLAGVLEHDGRYAPARAARWARDFERTVAMIAAAPAGLVGALPLVDEGELLALGCGSPARVDAAVAPQIWAQAARAPAALAVADEHGAIDYATLVARAGAVAAVLRARGLGAGDVVAVLAARSVELVVAQLGVLAAGAAYLPLDAAHPDARLAATIDDAKAALVLAGAALVDRVATAAPVLAIEAAIAHGEVAAPASELDAPAYVIYTSGSTGRPKGVVAGNRGLAALVAWHRRAFAIDPSDRATQLASPAFDAAVWEIWPYLCAGASVHVIDDERRLDPDAVVASLGALGATRTFLPTPLAEAVLASGAPAPARLRTLLTGGDRLRRSPGVRPFTVANCYGPTEATVVATWTALGDEPGAPPIGGPIDGTRVYVVDERGRLAPLGAAGELWIGGDGVALGYLGRPDLTAERFADDRFAPGRVYRTGDRARWREDGRLEFLGRLDRQLKVRGIRVEPAEIEAALLALAGVREAAVELHDATLVAYVAGDATGVRERLRGSLPEALIPQVVIELLDLPRTSSGKLDRAALPAPVALAGRPPEGPIELAVARVVGEVLGRGPVAADADFFALGGHSLAAARVAARLRAELGVELPVRAVFEAPTVASLALRVAAATASAPIPRAADGEAVSFAEERLWFLEELAPGAPGHVIAGAVVLRGRLDVDALAAALADVIARHDGLRTTFPARGGVPVRAVAASLDLALPVLGPVDPRAGARALAASPFELGRGPLIRASLHRLDPGEHALCVALHHAIADGWSVRILVSDLATAYAARIAGDAPTWPPLPVTLADVAAWQRGRVDAIDRALTWWADELAGAPAALDLPTDRARPPLFSGRGAHHPIAIDAALAAQVRAVAAARGTTPHAVLLAAWGALLARLAGAAEVVVGLPAASRDRLELEPLIGCLVDTLPVRLPIDGATRAGSLIDLAAARVTAALAHQEAPFERIVERLRPARDLGRTPIFQVMFAFEDDALPARRIGDLTLASVGVELDGARTDLVLDLKASADGLEGVIEYAADLFAPATIASWSVAYRRLLAAIVGEPGCRVDELALLDAAERHHVLVELARGPAVAEAPLVLEAIVAAAARAPEAIALTQGERAVSYRELIERALQLGHRLRRRGVIAGDLVAVAVPRSPETIIAVLGVLAAGAGFLAIDPGLPEARVRAMLADAGVRVVVDDAALEALDDEPAAPAATAAPDDVAYAIYTSGSTGTPKGVAITHAAIANRLAWGAAAHPTRPDDVFVQATSIGFDVAVWEILTPLAAAARLVLPPPASHFDVEALVTLIATEGVTVAGLTPSLLAAAIDVPALARCGALRLLFAGGEALPGPLATRIAQALPAVDLWNFYGPTEATIDATCRRCGPTELAGVVPIGRPVGGATAVVLDARMQPCPVGVAGELWIGGAGLARGYLGDPAKTAERFVATPLAEVPGRLYRTGDRVRWSADGELEYLGRTDAQIKLRGFRIELGEIEAVLRNHADVEDVVVVVRHDELPLERLLAELEAAAPPS